MSDAAVTAIVGGIVTVLAGTGKLVLEIIKRKDLEAELKKANATIRRLSKGAKKKDK